MRTPHGTPVLAFPSADPGVDEPLRLPGAVEPPRRGAVPLVASAVPVLGAAGLWLATGSAMMLWFAALGPAIAAASLVDGARAARRARRRARREADAARGRVRQLVADRHEAERARLWRLRPDVGALTDARHDVDDVWRPVAGRGDELVVGRGPQRSMVRIEGGDGDPASVALVRQAAVVEDAPVTVPAAAGVAVCAPAGLGRAVVRALALQMCLVTGPDRLQLTPASLRWGEPWLERLPHAAPHGPAAARAVRRLALWEPGTPPPDADTVLARVDPGQAPPPGCGAVLTLTGVDRGRLVHDAVGTDVGVEGVSVEQAMHLAEALAARAGSAFAAADPPVALAELLSCEPTGAGGLGVPLGTEHGAPFEVDLVADGPHAVVAGVTGAGKSELLTTWITALCAQCTTAEVTFLLADFKGGTAFDPLRALPHVTGVITDLDPDGARRALQSLRAELRRREAEIVAAGASGVEGTGLSRLVIVVDEYAALRAAHPELEDLFTDIAARGRALGMHLILGTQRASGTFRDTLLANTPLRISLRVTDPADSRALIGDDAAARLAADLDHRGIALVRRAADVTPRTVRVALSSPQLVAQAAARECGPAPRAAWLPALAEQLSLEEVSAGADGIVLGVADEPDRQRQVPVLLHARERGLCVLGMAGSGRTSALAAIHAQASTAVWVSADPESAWDQLAALDADGPAPGAVILVDDVDALLARYLLEHAQTVAERLERIIHASAGTAAVVLSAQRAGGAVGRMADLLPRRAILAMPTRADLVAAGGDGALWRDGSPPGRAQLDGRVMQFALASATPPRRAASAATWSPRASVTAAVLRGGPMTTALHRTAQTAGARVVDVDDAMPALGDESVQPLVIVGDGEQWQRSWRALQAVRERGELLIDAACPADYRVLTGDRATPPYCVPGRGRAWLMAAGEAPTRVVLPPAAG